MRYIGAYSLIGLLMRLLFSLLVVCVAVFSAQPSHAQIVLSKISDMFFGELEYDTTYNGQVRLGTNGALTTTGSGLVISGVGVPGQVGITATPADVVEIKCRRNVRLALPTGERLTVNQTEGVIDTGVPFGAGTRCDNLGGARNPIAVIDIAANPTPTVLIGGRIRINAGAGLASGVYSSTNTGGRAMRVRVLFQ